MRWNPLEHFVYWRWKRTTARAIKPGPLRVLFTSRIPMVYDPAFQSGGFFQVLDVHEAWLNRLMVWLQDD